MRDEPSTTAEVVCYMRASDQRRPQQQRVLDDPYAKLFLGRLTRAALATLEATGKLGERAEQLFPGLTTYILARHRFIDEHVDKALSTGEIKQLVLLGAGYDTRAYRFAKELSGCRIFEVDHPATTRRKAELAQTHAGTLPEIPISRVAIDFETTTLSDALAEAGFETNARSFFVWEGVSMYLTRAAIKETLRTIREMGGSDTEIAMDFWFLLDTPDVLSSAHRMSANLLHFLGEPITFGMHPEDVEHFLARLGFAVNDLATAEELERRFISDGRRVYPANYVLHARAD